MSDIHMSMSAGEAKAIEKNRLENEKLAQFLELLDKELKRRCEELTELGSEIFKNNEHNKNYSTGENIIKLRLSKSKSK